VGDDGLGDLQRGQARRAGQLQSDSRGVVAVGGFARPFDDDGGQVEGGQCAVGLSVGKSDPDGGGKFVMVEHDRQF